MINTVKRRDFLAFSAAAGACLAFGGRLNAATTKPALLKGIQGDPRDRVALKRWAAAGFDGVESLVWQLPAQEADAARKMAESEGLKIHSVQFGYGDFVTGESAATKTLQKMSVAIAAAKGYGADNVLFIPGRIDVKPMPEPWEFAIRFDEKTGHLKQAASTDNEKYRKYIEAHNHATDASRQGIEKLIPMAEKAGVVIALENVWNNLWVKPELFANFAASFDSPWVKTNFDIGNHVKYAPSQDWIRALDKLILKCHAKDFKLNPDGRGGVFCNLRDGSVDWPGVRKTLDEIGFNGWITVEGGNLSPEEDAQRLDRIIAGK